jgi:peptidyl-tRNA hydrolase
MKRFARWSPPTSGRLTRLAPANPEAGSTSPVVRCETKSQIATIHKTSNFMQLYEKAMTDAGLHTEVWPTNFERLRETNDLSARRTRRDTGGAELVRLVRTF